MKHKVKQTIGNSYIIIFSAAWISLIAWIALLVIIALTEYVGS